MTTAPDNLSPTTFDAWVDAYPSDQIPASEVWQQLGVDPSVQPICLGSLFRNARRAKDLTLERLASLVGIRSARLSDFEKGRRFPSLKTAVKLGQALDISFDMCFSLYSMEMLKQNDLAEGISGVILTRDSKAVQLVQ